jgi:hypothetical protein
MWMRSIVVGWLLVGGLWGCTSRPPPYGSEETLALPGSRRQTWAVAPVVNLSGARGVDPLLQADVLYIQLQQVTGLNVIPVNRVWDVYRALGIGQVQSQRQAELVCELLGCDALVLGTVTIYDPYEPPRMGAALQVFRRGDFRVPPDVDPRELARAAAPTTQAAMPPGHFVQAVGMFDAANGTTRQRLLAYASGRHDPQGPLRERGYLVEMDRYAGFVYHELLVELLGRM